MRQVLHMVYPPVRNAVWKKMQKGAEDFLTNTGNTVRNRVITHFGEEFMLTGEGRVSALYNGFLEKWDKKGLFSGSAFAAGGSALFHIDEGTFLHAAWKSGDRDEDSRGSALYIYVFGRHYARYAKRIQYILDGYDRSLDLSIYTVDASQDSRGSGKGESLRVMHTQVPGRSLDTVFFSGNEKEAVCTHIDRFNEMHEFYRKRQLLYKTGILLYGVPGNGKSSLVKALATKYKRDIVSINVGNLADIDLDTLALSINEDSAERYIVLFEDVDTLFLNREGAAAVDTGKIVNKLLQFLDSNTSPNNVIFIATTNHVDRLDNALLREGRFDLKVAVGQLDAAGAVEFGKSFGLREETMLSILRDIHAELGIADAPDLSSKEQRYNQSKLQAYILARIEHRSLAHVRHVHGEMEE